MKQPYFQERSLPARVLTYMEENAYVDVENMTEYLISTYRDYRGKSKRAFMKSVEKAYQWNKYCLEKEDEEDNSAVEEITDSDGGGGPDIMEIFDTPPQVQPKCLNNELSNLYKSPAVSSPKSTPKEDRIYVIDTKGNLQSNGVKTPQVPKSVESSQKKRKKDKDSDIDDIIKKRKKKQLSPETPNTTFAQMAGIDSLEDETFVLMANLKWPGVLQPLQKSVLVTGPSGSGKSTFTQALAGTTESALLRVAATELVGGVSGESEGRISEIFDQAVSLAPCVLLIEKIDVVVPKEGSGKSLEKRIGAQLSTCLQNLKVKHKDHKVMVVGETSRPENLDWDLRSSFDSEIFMAIPSEAARGQILKLLCEGTKLEGEMEEIAFRTPGYVAGDLKKLLEKAQSLAWKRKNHLLRGTTQGTSLMQRFTCFLTEFQKMYESQNVSFGVSLNMEDFMEALMHIIPALKREGFPTVPDVTWLDIGGLEDVKKDLREKILEPIRYAKLHKEFGASRPNGILMWGPPGCGKTLLAKAVANEAGINLLSVMGPELLNMYQGESERAVREVFSRARNVAPCIIFFDEFDSLCPVRSKGVESGSKTTIVNTLLAEMNGFSKREDVFVIAATNRPDILDPAVTRPGRIDTLLYVNVPDHEGRISIFKARTKNGTCPHLAPDVDLEKVSLLCENFSGADCDQLVYLASKEAIREVIQNSEAATLSTNTTTTSESAGTTSNRVPYTLSNLQSNRLVAKRHFMAALKKLKPSISVDEQRRYKKLYNKMEASRVRGELPGLPTDITPLATNTKNEEPMQINSTVV